MTRSLTRLRPVLLAVSSVLTLGLGATLAAADPLPPTELACPTDGSGIPYYSYYCGVGCVEGVGYCGADEICHCGYIP